MFKPKLPRDGSHFFIGLGGRIYIHNPDLVNLGHGRRLCWAAFDGWDNENADLWTVRMDGSGPVGPLDEISWESVSQHIHSSVWGQAAVIEHMLYFYGSDAENQIAVDHKRHLECQREQTLQRAMQRLDHCALLEMVDY
jgi:hypothetical protein